MAEFLTGESFASETGGARYIPSLATNRFPYWSTRLQTGLESRAAQIVLVALVQSGDSGAKLQTLRPHKPLGSLCVEGNRVKRENAQMVGGNSAYYETDWAVSEYNREDGLRPLEMTLVQQFFPPPPC